ncbi:MAG: PDZ domain-containing protein [Gemmatimonadales bacterium]
MRPSTGVTRAAPLLNVQGGPGRRHPARRSSAYDRCQHGYAFAIPIDLARQVMEQLITKGKVERAALGVLVRDATSEDAEYVGLEGIYGVKIDEFTDGSPARTAGLQSGDVVVSIDGERVDYTAQLQQLVGFKKPGSSVKVEVARKGGARKFYSVRLVAQGDPQEIAANDEEPASEPESPPSVAKERLGITVDAIDAEAATRLNLPRGTQGILVTSVDPYGPADKLLVAESYPVITAVEGTAVKNEADLRAALRSARAGEVVSLTVLQPQQQGAPRTTVVRIKLN